MRLHPLLLLGIVILEPATALAVPAYTVTNLGGYYEFGVASINARGQVRGRAIIANGLEHAILWDPVAGMRDLGALGGVTSVGTGINTHGQVTGGAQGRRMKSW